MFERARLSEIERDRLNAEGGGREKGNSQGILTQRDDSVQLTSNISNLVSIKTVKNVLLFLSSSTKDVGARRSTVQSLPV
jgi:hypothetical protein